MMKEKGTAVSYYSLGAMERERNCSAGTSTFFFDLLPFYLLQGMGANTVDILMLSPLQIPAVTQV